MANEPEKLGKYQIVGKLGKGAMGEVYKGHDPVLNRHVAIKVIAESLDADSDLVERFRREARMAGQLNHPNIITIYDFVEEEGNLYIVMELLDGQDLKDVIKSGSPLTVDQLLDIMVQIADGLGFAHDAGLVHRDLKPANIHITKKGQIKILDFGLVREESSDMTKTGHIMGTPNYMSPEQVQGLKVDPRSDIFSLGAVFYELLTRKKPFSATSIHATMFKVVQGEREPLATYTHLPAPIVAMIDRALDPNPDKRFADGNALREHLRTIRKEATAGGGADATITGISKLDATILNPPPEPGSHPSGPSGPSGPSSPSAPARSVRSVSARAETGASVAGSQGGTMRRREMTSHSMDAATPSRPIGLYVTGGILVAAIAAGLFYLSGGPEQKGPSVEELSQQLSASQQELMLTSLERRDYSAALSQADAIIANDPQNPEALRVQSEARQALDEIDAAVTQARAALERGATEEAAEALGRVLALDPSHPLGAELNDQLNQHFQSQAEGARAEMESARNAAAAAGANGRAEFRQADLRRQEASADFNRGEYTSATQKYLAARDQFGQSGAAHRQAEGQRRAQAERQATSEAEARDTFERAQKEWTRLRNQPADAGVASQPSYQRAMSEETSAKALERSGDLAGAARAYGTATSYLEAARRDYAEAQSQSRRAAVASTSVASTSSAPVTSSAPTRAQEETAIRQTLATYERAIESQSLDLFRQAKPNLTRDEAKRLTDSFQTIDSHDVELDIRTVTIEGNTATVAVTRADIIVIRGRSQNGNRRQQSFVLQKSNGHWVIILIQ